MARGDQLARQWRIIQILIGSQMGRTAGELAKTLGCHVRTIYRDLEALESGGFPLYTDKTDGKSRWHILDQARRQLPLPLSLTEAMALYFSRDLLKTMEGTIFHQSLSKLIDKLEATLPPQIRQYINNSLEHLHVGTKARRRSANIQPKLELLQEAIAGRRTITMDYFTMSRRSSSLRQVEPYHLWFFDGTFYLIGYCRLRKEVRIFAVDRIRELGLNDEVFQPPENFDPDAWMMDSFGVFRGKPVKVVIEFSPKVAGYIEEQIWHPSQQIDRKDDGRLVLTVKVAGLEEIKHWLLQWGGQARVLEPESLARAIQDEAQAICRVYRSP